MKKGYKKAVFEGIITSFIIVLFSSLSFSFFVYQFYSVQFLLILLISLLSFFSFWIGFSYVLSYLNKEPFRNSLIRDGKAFIPFFLLLLNLLKIEIYNPKIWFAYLFILVLSTFSFLNVRFINWDIVRKRFFLKSSILLFILLFSLILLYTFIFTYLSFERHYRLMTSLDLAGFNQALWNTIRGRILETSLYGRNFLGIHMSPILLFLVPIYALWQDERIFLFFQSLFLGIAALPIYLIAYHRLKDRFISLVFASCYLLFPFLSRINLFDFHEICFAPFLLSLTFLALIKKKFKTYFILLFLSLMIKENVPLVGFGLGIYAFFRIDKKIGIITVLISLLWLSLAFKVLIPWIRQATSTIQTTEDYEFLVRYKYLGNSINEITKNIFFHPFAIFKTILLPQKVVTIVLLFFPFGFLSLLSMAFIPSILPLLFELIAYFKVQYLLLWQYSALIIPFTVISAIYGFGNIVERFKKKAQIQWAIPISIFLLINSFLSNWHFSILPFTEESFDAEEYKIGFHKSLFFLPNFKMDKKERDHISLFYTLKKLISKDAPLSCQNEWLAHLSSRRHIFQFLPGNIRFEDADYILLDRSKRDLNFSLFLEGLERLENDKRFQKIFEEEFGDGFCIFIRKEKITGFLLSSERLLKSKPSKEAHFILSSIYFNLQRYKDALKEAGEAIKIDPLLETPWVIIGDSCLFLGNNINKAYSAYKKAVNIDLLHLPRLLKVANAYTNKGLTKKAENVRKEIIKAVSLLKKREEQEPSNIFLKKQLAFIYANIGYYDEAISILKRILEIEPNDFWSRDVLKSLGK
ncbi:MAG: DUF2079 domain-containing protein [bacterium]